MEKLANIMDPSMMN
jgi:hypothetical protein